MKFLNLQLIQLFFFLLKLVSEVFLCVLPHNDTFPESHSRNLETYVVFLHIYLFLRTIISPYFSVLGVLLVNVVYQFPEIINTWKILNHIDYFPNIQNFFKN